MDKKDEIILQQLEVIRTMTERNLRSMGDDFWRQQRFLGHAPVPGGKARGEDGPQDP